MAIRDIITKGLFSPSTYLVTKGFGSSYTNKASNKAHRITKATERRRIVSAKRR
jgi:hypothetical protein